MRLIRKIFRLKPKKFSGIDIGTTSLRVVELRKKKGKIFLHNYGEIESFLFDNSLERAKKEEVSSYEKFVASNIKDIRKAAGILVKDTNIAIPDFFSFYITLNLPTMSKEEIIQAIQYEVRPHIPLPLSEITIDWEITEGEMSKTPVKILVVAIPNDIIIQYKRIASLGGIKLKSLESEVISLKRALITEEEKDKVIGLIDIGAKSTTCSVLDNNVLKLSHSFKIGGNKLSQSLVNSLKINYNKAEEIKKEKGLLKDERIKEILLLSIDSAIEEMRRVFRDYQGRQKKEIDKIILFGKSAFMPGLREHISKELNKEVEIADPFKKIILPESLKKLPEERKMALGVPIGIALKELI